MTRHVADRIAAGLGGLAPAQRRVARFFTEHATQLGFFSAAEIAARLGTSDATVVRTAQTLGYRGLADLKRALLDDAPPPEPTPSARLGATLRHATAPRDVLEHVLDVHRAALNAARNSLDERFPAAVALLAAAERIVLSGTGPSAAVAQYAAVLLGRVGRPATTITATGVSMADQAMGLRRGDALLLLAYTRLHTHAAVLIGLARRRRIPVLLVTDVLADVDGADLVLSCPRGMPGEQSSHAVTLLLLEATAVALAATGPARATTALSELNRLRGELLGVPADVDTPDADPR
ncbi:MAG TPA: MurR/RpiR family transcriptional regulator [Pseudonocardiaceae bacterium]|jgi:DNA-binding MurR/RpiR family transcriptional regulator|nr:MurR/RpiR family transcriptional regulator [Pseudonocardiaceae bacterium]